MWSVERVFGFKPPRRPQLGWWATLTLCLVTATGFFTDLQRLENPVGEKYVPYFPPGQNDFSSPYCGARAWLAGVNPYHNDRPEFRCLMGGLQRVDGVDFTYFYPPGHLLTFAPLAAWKGADWTGAAQIWHRFNVVALLAVAALTWALARRTTAHRLTPFLIALLYGALALNPGTELGLERGQSDICLALLCWSAILCSVRGADGLAVFLAIWGTSMKGYPLLLTSGLALLALARGKWKQMLAGAGAAVVAFVLPVVRYSGEAAKVVRYRSDMFQAVWYNAGFRNLVYRWSPARAEQGRIALTAFALLVTGGAWIQTWRATARGSPTSSLWLIVFATASLGTFIGYSAYSVPYNLILILPGTLLLATFQERVSASLALPPWARNGLGAAIVGCLFLLFICRLGNDPPGYVGNIPAAAYGLALLFLIFSVLVARALTLRPEATPGG